MRLYEIVYIFDAALDEADVTSKLEGFHARPRRRPRRR